MKYISTENRQINLITIITPLFLVILAVFMLSRFLPTFSVLILLACILFVIAFINTDVALIILILSMLLSPEFSIGGIPGRDVVVRADDVFLLVIFIGWLAKMAVNKELGLLKFTPLNKIIFIYILVALVATLLGELQGYVNIKYSFFYILKYIEYFLLFFMVSNNIRDMKQVKLFVFFLLLTCFIVGAYAWLQHLAGIQRVAAPFDGSGIRGEANTLGGYLLFMIGPIFGLIVCTASFRLRVLLLSFLGFIIPPFLFTQSRGAWLGFFPMFLALIIVSRKVKMVLVIVFLAFMISAPVILPEFVKKRVQTTFVPYETYTVFGRQFSFDESSVIRIGVWKNTIEKWGKSPLLGYGVLGGGGVVDSQYARVLIETGIIGFFVFAWLMIGVYRTGWQAFKKAENNNFAEGLSLGFMAGFAGLLTQALTAGTFIIVRITGPFWFLTALMVSLPELLHRHEKKD